MENPINSNPPQNEAKNSENSCFTDTGSAIFSKSDANLAPKSPENGANGHDLQENEENQPKTLENQGNQPFLGQNSANLSGKTANLGESSAVIQENNATTAQNNGKVAQNITQTTQNGAETTQNSCKTKENSGVSPQNSSKTQENSGVSPQSSASAPESARAQPNELNLLSEDNIIAFSKDFPSVDIEKVRTNQGFSALLGTIMHNPTLSSVYSCFNSIVEAAEESSRGKILHALAALDASVGSLSSTQPSERGYFTKEQVMKMSREEVKENLDKIRASQSNW